MNIPKKQVVNRKSQIKALFFMKKIKQKAIAKILWVSERTVRRYIKKSK